MEDCMEGSLHRRGFTSHHDGLTDILHEIGTLQIKSKIHRIPFKEPKIKKSIRASKNQRLLWSPSRVGRACGRARSILKSLLLPDQTNPSREPTFE
uniref:Ovule protein n=1 Tax=Steinernema glaseri TaxID=37863 RepID=A0A1I7ZJK7_9BILA